MKRIIYFDHHSDGSSFYRLLPLTYISNSELSITRSTERNITFMDLANYDAVVLLRPTSEAHLSIIKLSKDCGLRVISDFDDDVLNVPHDNPMHDTYGDQKQYTNECLRLSDEVWVTTEGIKQSFRMYNNNIHVIPNGHNDVLFGKEKKKDFTYNKIAMYRGGHSHMGDMYAPGVSEWIVDTVNSNPDWKFYFLGQRFEWIEKRCSQGNHYTHPGASVVQFHKLMHQYNPTVFFYPLADNVFNRGKSNCSWLEATYSGAAYFGNTELPEFKKKFIYPLDKLGRFLNHQGTDLRDANELSWQYILDNLLVTNINKLREERLLKT